MIPSPISVTDKHWSWMMLTWTIHTKTNGLLFFISPKLNVHLRQIWFEARSVRMSTFVQILTWLFCKGMKRVQNIQCPLRLRSVPCSPMNVQSNVLQCRRTFSSVLHENVIYAFCIGLWSEILIWIGLAQFWTIANAQKHNIVFIYRLAKYGCITNAMNFLNTQVLSHRTDDRRKAKISRSGLVQNNKHRICYECVYSLPCKSSVLDDTTTSALLCSRF